MKIGGCTRDLRHGFWEAAAFLRSRGGGGDAQEGG